MSTPTTTPKGRAEEGGHPRPGALESGSTGSAARAYQDFVVGSRSWWTLLEYEVAMSWGALLPGALGLALRRLLWPRLFAEAGRGTVWGRNTVVRHPGKMSIGSRVLVDDDCFFDAKGCRKGEFRIGDDVVISRGTMITGKGGSVHIGARVNIGNGCMILSDAGISIGADTMLAGACYVGGGAYDADAPLDAPISKHPVSARPVRIGEGCWLGAGVVVIEGVTVGDGSIIGAGSVVTRDVPAYAIAVGIPAKVLRLRRGADEAELP